VLLRQLFSATNLSFPFVFSDSSRFAFFELLRRPGSWLRNASGVQFALWIVVQRAAQPACALRTFPAAGSRFHFGADPTPIKVSFFLVVASSSGVPSQLSRLPGAQRPRGFFQPALRFAAAQGQRADRRCSGSDAL
jgi:hypothetical protein